MKWLIREFTHVYEVNLVKNKLDQDLSKQSHIQIPRTPVQDQRLLIQATYSVKLMTAMPDKHMTLVEDPKPMWKLRFIKSQLPQKLDGFHTNQLNML